MTNEMGAETSAPATATTRRVTVLDSALTTFARFGYRKTTMDDIARAARISRPGLYFLFSSKEELFREAVQRALEHDIALVEQTLGDARRPLRARLLDSFDQWAGRYIGPMASDLAAVVDDNPDLLGDLALSFPQRFENLVTTALSALGSKPSPGSSHEIARTLISTAIGIKHQVQDRSEYLARLEVAIDLLLSAPPREPVAAA